jgi:uncharacterized phosphosugar-binding protein
MTYAYPALAHDVIDRIVSEELGNIDAAVALIEPRLRDGGVLHVFGTGHARIPMHEMAGRAGGLMSVNLVRMSDLVMHGGSEPSALADPLLERDPAFAAPLFELIRTQEGDAVLMASNSGINGTVVEFAGLVRAAGLPLVAITSVRHSAAVESRHPSGRKLMDLADVVIDNGAPAGDAALDLGDGIQIGAVSNLAGVVIVQLLTEGIARAALAAGARPDVYRSMNLPDGDDRNAAGLARIAARVRPIEP